MSIRPHDDETSLSTIGRGLLLGLSICVIAVFAVALQLRPDPRGHGTHQQLGLPACGFRLVTGYPCPGCGMTTSFACFVRGDFAASAEANPAGLLLATVSVAFILWSLPSVVRGRLWRVSNPGWTAGLLILCVSIAAILVWVFRIVKSIV